MEGDAKMEFNGGIPNIKQNGLIRKTFAPDIPLNLSLLASPLHSISISYCLAPATTGNRSPSLTEY